MCRPATGNVSQALGGKPGSNYSVGIKPRSQFGPPKAPEPPPPPPLEPLPPASNANTVLSTMALPGGLGTIESMAPQSEVLSAVPTLDSPFGLESQRVKKAKARLSIAM